MWGGRNDAVIAGVVDSLFRTRFLDIGKCAGCQTQTMGIYGPSTAYECFYCRKCWSSYLKKDCAEDEFKEWKAFAAQEPRKCPVESSRHADLKCLLLAISRIEGVSVNFPATLSSYDRAIVHTFCEQEPELKKLSHESHGEKGALRYLRVGNGSDGVAEARALLGEALPAPAAQVLAAEKEDRAAQEEEVPPPPPPPPSTKPAAPAVTPAKEEPPAAEPQPPSTTTPAKQPVAKQAATTPAAAKPAAAKPPAAKQGAAEKQQAAAKQPSPTQQPPSKQGPPPAASAAPPVVAPPASAEDFPDLSAGRSAPKGKKNKGKR